MIVVDCLLLSCLIAWVLSLTFQLSLLLFYFATSLFFLYWFLIWLSVYVSYSVFDLFDDLVINKTFDNGRWEDLTCFGSQACRDYYYFWLLLMVVVDYLLLSCSSGMHMNVELPYWQHVPCILMHHVITVASYVHYAKFRIHRPTDLCVVHDKGLAHGLPLHTTIFSLASNFCAIAPPKVLFWGSVSLFGWWLKPSIWLVAKAVYLVGG